MKVNLAVLLAQRGVSITELSENTKLSRTTLTQLNQNSGKGVQFDTLEKICSYLNVTPNDLLILDNSTQSELNIINEKINELFGRMKIVESEVRK